MAYEPPKKNTAYITYVDLVSRAAPWGFQTNPTLAAGDAQVSIDGGAYAALATLPVVTPVGSTSVKLSLSAAEMNGDNIHVVFRDQAGAEWNDLGLNIPTAGKQFETLAESADVPSANANADALLDRAAGVETGWSLRQAMRVVLATLAGKLSGAGTTAVAIRDVNDTKDRVAATVDADGNRSAVTLDAT